MCILAPATRLVASCRVLSRPAVRPVASVSRPCRVHVASVLRPVASLSCPVASRRVPSASRRASARVSERHQTPHCVPGRVRARLVASCRVSSRLVSSPCASRLLVPLPQPPTSRVKPWPQRATQAFASVVLPFPRRMPGCVGGTS